MRVQTFLKRHRDVPFLFIVPQGLVFVGLEKRRLAAVVVFNVSENAFLFFADAEIQLLDVSALSHGLGFSLHNDMAVLNNAAKIRVAQGNHGILLGNQEADPFFLLQGFDNLKNFLNKLGQWYEHHDCRHVGRTGLRC